MLHDATETAGATRTTGRSRTRVRWLWVSDLTTLACTLLATELALSLPGPLHDALRARSGVAGTAHVAVAAALLVMWMGALAWRGSRNDLVVGRGTTEFRRLTEAGFGVYALLCAAAILTGADIARGPLLVGFPATLGALCLERLLWRRWVTARRTLDARRKTEAMPAERERTDPGYRRAS